MGKISTTSPVGVDSALCIKAEVRAVMRLPPSLVGVDPAIRIKAEDRVAVQLPTSPVGPRAPTRGVSISPVGVGVLATRV